MSLKKKAMHHGMKLMSDPRVMKLMQDERFMKAMMAAMSVPGRVTTAAQEHPIASNVAHRRAAVCPGCAGLRNRVD
jgi:cell division FtsZ-interacting protein ZapD